MTKSKCPIEEYCMKQGLKKCMFEKDCHQEYKKICKFNRKLINELRFEILEYN